MRRFDWRSAAVSSVVAGIAGVLLATAAAAETRPQYGGTLHVAMRAAPTSLDPAEVELRGNSTSSVQADSLARRSLTLLMFDTLVTIDGSGRALPALATGWQTQGQPGNRWQFRIRRGVKFHDGTAFTAELAATSLRVSNPSWNVSADGDSVVIERREPDPELLAELALPRNAIVKRNGDNAPSGTGPFQVVAWTPGKTLTLAADENSWRGRPYLDAIEIEMGKSFREQATAQQLGSVDLIEVAPEQTRRISQEGRRLTSSHPMELLALVFAREAASTDEKLLRDALALSVERGSIHSVLLQGAGESAGGLLPNWMGGYEFVFPTGADLTRARQLREQVHTVPTWTLGYDGADPVAHLLAERLALNARDAGLSLQPAASSNSTAGSAGSTDVRLVRIPLASSDPWIALGNVAGLAEMAAGKEGGSIEDLYTSEAAMLATRRVIPLFHLPVSYAASASLNNWSLRPDGSWTLTDAWLASAKP
jgi:peptide/nickel transport system substrate-binding protein